VKKVKVLLIGPVPPPVGGIAFYVQDLLNSQLENVEFEVFNTSLPSWIAPFDREGKMMYSAILEKGIWGAVKMFGYVTVSYIILFGKLIYSRPDIVQVFPSSYWGYWRHWFYLLMSKPFVPNTILHVLNAIDIFYENVGRLQKFIIKQSLNSANLYLLQSYGLAKWVEQYSQRKVVGIFNGIHLDIIPSDQAKFVSFSNKEALVGITIGKLGTTKGTYDILGAIANIKADNEIVNWIFVGGGDIDTFQRIANDYGITEQVAFCGSVADKTKWQLLMGADFFCLPSYEEGQPISIIEAMAVGLPIISSEVGSIPEIIEDGVNGFIIVPGDQQALAHSVQKLCRDTFIRQQMRENSARFSQERHDIRQLFEKLGDIYTELMR